MRDDLAASNTLRYAGRYHDADTLATRGLAAASEIGYPPLVAEAEVSLAPLLEVRGDAAEAERLLRDALLLAETSDHVQIAATASTALTTLLLRRRGGTERAQEMAERCWSSLVRAAHPADATMAYLQARQAIAMQEGDYAEALTWSERRLRRRTSPSGRRWH